MGVFTWVSAVSFLTSDPNQQQLKLVPLFLFFKLKEKRGELKQTRGPFVCVRLHVEQKGGAGCY